MDLDVIKYILLFSIYLFNINIIIVVMLSYIIIYFLSDLKSNFPPESNRIHTNPLHSCGCRQSHLHKSTQCTHIVRITKNYYYYEIFFYTYYPRLLRQRLRNKASQIKKKKCFKRGSCHYLFTTKAIDGKTSLIKYQMF